MNKLFVVCARHNGIPGPECIGCFYDEKIAEEQARGRRYREALELLCYSVAGTDGTKTNSEFPEWYRARLKVANIALQSDGEGAKPVSKCNHADYGYKECPLGCDMPEIKSSGEGEVSK